MNLVLQSTDRVLIESVRLALAGEGIEVVLNDESGAALPFVPVKVLVSSVDFKRAREIVRDLVPTSPSSSVPRANRRFWSVVLLALAILLLIFFGNILIG
ncbi:MAG: hypothetical protein DMD38_05540 [Gemmatimonadetes bacterium]|nr:MAG: hypothetical protein AUI86_11405 [Gemmatimonadetes bacterium 13_1_40CM_3_66_12]OLD85772.1 MAG: hypothetical protein AUG85_12530 [Gemmatimonadetes bacterium 13_1_20CM_4_66_11]PYP97137.1 MAG: hypothetical protein DMD38_05540 [Gemmatimonadota bacterium]